MKIPRLNKWTFNLSVDKCPMLLMPLIRQLNFYFIKLNHIPEEGEQLEQKHYKGFWLKFYFIKIISTKIK